ncbi:MAG TPA: hypothetical protein VKH46_15355 [Thermoanaerobaculia bacterium]|jgi:hypothetical protein|nr:hypothetical protein [Thermoanaerobaculia bacterium]
MKSSERAELPDIERDIPTTREDVAMLHDLWIGKPGVNLLPLLLRLQSGLPPREPSRATSEGWEPFTLG